MRIELRDEQRLRMLRSIQQFFSDELDESISDFNAERLLDFFVHQLGAPVYNQAIRDAHGFVSEKLADLEGEFYEPEDPY